MIIEPDGLWRNTVDGTSFNLGGVTPTTDDDRNDDLIEVSEPIPRSVKQEPISMSTGVMLERTPVQSREASTPSSAVRPSNRKRSAPTSVIDLTGSDDDDESPVPPSKRQALNANGRGLSSQSAHQAVAGSPLNGRPYSSSY